MGNTKRKRDKKLEARIESYEEIPAQKRKGYHRPGSQNLHKQTGGTNGRGSRRR